MSQIPLALPGKCDFFGCNQPVCPSDMKYDYPSRRFCQSHSDEIGELFTKNDVHGIIEWGKKSKPSLKEKSIKY